MLKLNGKQKRELPQKFEPNPINKSRPKYPTNILGIANNPKTKPIAQLPRPRRPRAPRGSLRFPPDFLEPAVFVVVVVLCHVKRISCQPEKTTLHGGQSRSWSTELEKKTVWQRTPPPPPPYAHTYITRSEKIKIKIMRRIYTPRRYAGLGPSCVCTRIPSTRRLGQWVLLPKIIRFRVR